MSFLIGGIKFASNRLLIRQAAQPLTTGKTGDKWEQTIDNMREYGLEERLRTFWKDGMTIGKKIDNLERHFDDGKEH